MAGLSLIEAALGPLGLILRGGFHPRAEDGVPSLPDGRAPATLLLVGNAGPDLWQVFAASPEAADGRPDPLDRWARRVLEPLAKDLGGVALFPFGGPPYRPFVAWARRSEPVAESPIGMLIHPEFGLWHAYRGALALPDRFDLPETADRPAGGGRPLTPCDDCAERPCLAACPVGAFRPEGYAVKTCAAHVAAPAGADCLELGCHARRACPVGAAFRYAGPQARFHMEAFVGPRRPPAARSMREPAQVPGETGARPRRRLH